MIPDWYELVLLSLASYRVTRLFGSDRILDRPRDWLGDQIPFRYHEAFDYFVGCFWCLGSWIAFTWWLAWQIWPHSTLIVAGAASIMAIVGYMNAIKSD